MTHDAAAETERRKEDHLRIPLERDVRSMPSPWSAVRLRHEALPDFDLDDVDTSTVFLGRTLAAPIQITGMTGGARAAKTFNDRLAAAASQHGLALGVGSQRAAIENPQLAETYAVILEHDVPARFANLGLPQLIAWGEEAAAHAETAIEMIDGHGIWIHLNYVQEAVQPEGDTQAAGGLEAIRSLADALSTPVMVKETGAGIDGATARRLAGTGVAAIDVGGLGGTSFAAVEHHRAQDQGDALQARLGRDFWDWGVPTPEAIVSVRGACPDLPIVATGGLETGVDALRALALGADVAGFAGQMFRAAADDRATEEAGFLVEALKTGLFLAGVQRASSVGQDHLG